MEGPAQATPWLMLIVIALASVGGSAFMAFAETCLTSLSQSRTQALMASEGQRAKALKLWLDQPHAVLVTLLVGNTLADVVATALLTKAALEIWGDPAVAWVIGIMTFLSLTYGEILPKALARVHAVRAAVPTIQVVAVLHYALLPATWLLSHYTRFTVRALGGGRSDRSDVTEAELEAMVDLGSREGTLAPAKADHLRAVFRLYERTVREILVPRTDLVAVDLEDAPEALVKAVDASGHSRVPAYRGRIDEIAGILHAKDLLHRVLSLGRTPTSAEIEECLREPVYVPESMRLDTLLWLFRSKRQHLAIVLDEYGGTAGIVALEDVLEELVGEIWDEHDEEAPVLVRRGPGRWTASGRVSLSELEEKLGLELPEAPEYDTLAGLLMDLAGRVPAAGSAHEHGGYRFEVLTANEKTVGLVRATKLEPR